MKGGDVIRRARRRAALTQRELATRLDTTASVISRWEHGLVEPGFATVVHAARACGAELEDVLREPDIEPHDASLLDTTLALSVDERLQRLIDHVRFVRAGRAAMATRR